MKESLKLEFYNYLISMLSTIQLYKISNNEEDKNELIDKLEKESMETLNNFSNFNFNRINYFYKDYRPSQLIRFLLLIKDREGNLLFKKEVVKNENKYNVLTFCCCLQQIYFHCRYSPRFRLLPARTNRRTATCCCPRNPSSTTRTMPLTRRISGR